MKERTEKGASMCCTVYEKIKDMSNLSVGADYDLSLKVTDPSSEDASACSHRFCGSSKHNLMALLAMGGLVALSLSILVGLVHAFCSFICRVK